MKVVAAFILGGLVVWIGGYLYLLWMFRKGVG